MQTDCIGIDIGYGFTKTCRGEDRHIFPTAITLMASEPTFSDVEPVFVNGHRFLVGKEAEREGATIDTRHSHFVTSDAWLAILGHALHLHNFARGDIVLGVPPGMYSRVYGQRIRDAMKQSDIRISEEPYRFNGNVKIIPQGAGIFFRYVKDHPEDFRKNVTVIDIGHHTLDMTFFCEGKYVESATESQEIGVSLILDSISKAFYREHRFSIGFKGALDILLERQITHLGTRYAVDARDEEIARYTQRIDSVLDRYLEKLPVPPDVGILGGGGALVIRDIASFKHRLLLVSEPAMANAVGYYYFGNSVK
jgi:actin-like ATPase involved in cell morphogenesis